MTLEEINAILRPLGDNLGFETPLELDDSGVAQLTYADGDAPIEIDLERDGESQRLMLFLDAGSTADSENREALLADLLQENLRSLAPAGISIGLGADGERVVMSRAVHEVDLANGELVDIFEAFVAAGVAVQQKLGGETGAEPDAPGEEGMMRI